MIRIKKNFKILNENCTQTPEVSAPYTEAEIGDALKDLNPGKVTGSDHMHPKILDKLLLKYQKIAIIILLRHLVVRGIQKFKQSKIIAILKPGKSNERSENNCLIALLNMLQTFVKSNPYPN